MLFDVFLRELFVNSKRYCQVGKSDLEQVQGLICGALGVGQLPGGTRPNDGSLERPLLSIICLGFYT